MRFLIALGLLAGMFYGGRFEVRVRTPHGAQATAGSGGTAHTADGNLYPPKK